MPSEDTRFKPGQSGNPLGQPKLPRDIVEARKLNRVEFERVLNRYIHLSPIEIKEVAENPVTPALEVLVAKIIFMGIKNGDEKRLGFILDRLGIVVKQKISLDGGEDSDGNAKPLQIQRVDLLDRIKQLGEAIKKGDGNGEA